MNFPITFKLDEEFRQRNRKHTAQERFNLRRIIEEEGCCDGALTVGLIGTDKVLVDGYNTLSICQELGTVPTEPRYLPFKDRAAALEWIDLRQRSRRNLTKEEMEARRAERTPRVVAAHVEGQSTRAIAEAEGVSQSTIKRDLQAAAESGDSVSPPSGTIVGKDGREHPAKRQLPRCDRCIRLNRNLEDCQQCNMIRGVKAKSAAPSPKSPPASPATSKAATGNNCPTCGQKLPAAASKAFVKPTVEEVRDYCNERQNGINPEMFLDHYTANGWRIGKAAMKDWKAAVRTWEQSPLRVERNGKPDLHAGLKAFVDGDEE